MNTVEILRLLVTINGVLLGFQSLRVIATYSSVYAMTKDDWKRQLPLHVWLIALSYFIFVVATTSILYVNEESLLSRCLIYGAAGLVGQYALYNVLQYDRRRYSKATNFMDPDDVKDR